MDNNRDYRRARRAERSRHGFYVHLSVFLAVMAFLLMINLSSGGPWWIQWPFFGWGIGIVAHAASVFAPAGRLRPVPADMVGSETDERRPRPPKPARTVSVAELKSRFGGLDRRLAEMEARVTSDEFGLRQKFRDLNA